ncbi:type II RES/Xre toxin-antitoxin system antitoxin [Flectobacillus major]|jgi:putative toxin-antitoxin system antitoxin component (TIGR02293 family)|uniref:type II RES/Xre toxin-antitoxin system antitoxin n=1 Tax=Flectobacillus major TaxID=103 RepID=UPI00040D1A92|nr:antitoxin Xre/MbcA/ParS toxin-binding domain-containing protein [Flectobacillus major]
MARDDISSIYQKYAPQIKNNTAIVLSARNGLNANAFYDIFILSGFKKEQLAELFHTSTKTIQRYTQSNANLDVVSSEHALKLIALYQKGTEIFGNIEAFRNWVNKPAYGLGWQIPYDLMQTSGGIELIMEELIRIEYGDLA